jgi:hypothetical protein
MVKGRGQGGPIGSRLIGLFASLFFSIPTAVLVWLGPESVTSSSEIHLKSMQ